MKRRWFVLILIAGIILALAAAAGVFLTRPPALIVTDVPIAAIYGTRRMLIRQIWNSLQLWRPVIPAPVAEGIGSDMVVFAIDDAASKWSAKKPYCVIFPYEYADGFRRYQEQRPEIPAILLTGRSGGNGGGSPNNGGASFVFGTDVERDFYRAGLGAAILGRGKPGNVVVFQDRSIQTTGRDAFIQGMKEGGNENAPRFLYSFAELSDPDTISCVVLIGAGAEYFEKKPQAPIIFFTWLDPESSSSEVALIFDDSPWTLAVPAIRMMTEKQNEGRIPSEALVISAQMADTILAKELKKALGASREKKP